MEHVWIFKKPQKNYLVAQIKKRIQRKKNFVACIVGETGSGKSYYALRLAELIKPNFDVNLNVVFTAKDFLKRINDRDPETMLKKGDVLIFDEAGTGEGISSREWWNLTNRLINYMLQTFRYRQIICFFTVPLQHFIDKQARELVHCVITMQKILHNKKIARARIKCIQPNYMTGKIYAKRPIVYVAGFPPRKIDMLGLRIPSKNLRREYERKKDVWNREFGKKLLRELEIKESDEKKDEPKVIIRQPLTERQKEIYELKKQGYSYREIAEKLGISRRTIISIFNVVKKKGWEL